jgi:protein-S-isoprenylcysteine O-methyltransferase Ste14
MRSVETFRLLQVAVMVVFAVLISDFRRRQGSSPLLPTASVLVLKLVYPIPFLVYLSTVWRLRAIESRDLAALALTAAGAVIVARARLDIGLSYTWTGYRKTRPLLVTRGVYGWIRHPIYTGIGLFTAGGVLTVLRRVSWAAHVVAGVGIVYILAFLSVAAARETRFLADTLGEEFERYRRRVGAFWPRLGRRETEPPRPSPEWR